MKKSSIYFSVAFLGLSACSGSSNKQAALSRTQSVDSVYSNWNKSRKSVRIYTDCVDSLSMGVCSVPSDATEDEQLWRKGIQLTYQPSLKAYTRENLSTGDTAATFYISQPYFPNVGVGDSIHVVAPFTDICYGKEIARKVDTNLSISYKMKYVFSLLSISISSNELTDYLESLSLSGDAVSSEGYVFPYTGKTSPIPSKKSLRLDVDRVLSRSCRLNTLLFQSNAPSKLNMQFAINKKNYSYQTEVPALSAHQMLCLNLHFNGQRIVPGSSWIKDRAEKVQSPFPVLAPVRLGWYLNTDASFSETYSAKSTAVVYQLDKSGIHGRAIALKDYPEMINYSSVLKSNNQYVATIDGKLKNGFINAVGSEQAAAKLIFNPSLGYPQTTAFGLRNGVTYRQIQSQDDGSYIPSLGELSDLYYFLQDYSKIKINTQHFDPMEGLYMSSTEQNKRFYYGVDFDNGGISGEYAKDFVKMKIRKFYIF